MRHGWEVRTSVATLGLPAVGDIRSHDEVEGLAVNDKRHAFGVIYESQAVPLIDLTACDT
jgi:hypothetical protein